MFSKKTFPPLLKRGQLGKDGGDDYEGKGKVSIPATADEKNCVFSLTLEKRAIEGERHHPPSSRKD